MALRRLLGTSVLTGLLVTVPVFLAASCSETGTAPSSPGDATSPETTATEASDADASDPDATDATLCPPPADDAQRCSGNDPAFVFFPPVACDPATLAGTADAAGAEASVDASGDAAADGGMGPCYGVSTIDVSFPPAACSALLGVESRGVVMTGSGAAAPQITEPLDGDMLSPDNWTIFAWNAPMTRLSPLQHLLDWIEPSAYALSPLNGEGYVLEFSAGCSELLRVMVVSPFWAPDPVSWARLTAHTGPITIRVIAAKFANNGIAAGTVPLASTPISVTMMN